MIHGNRLVVFMSKKWLHIQFWCQMNISFFCSSTMIFCDKVWVPLGSKILFFIQIWESRRNILSLIEKSYSFCIRIRNLHRMVVLTLRVNVIKYLSTAFLIQSVILHGNTLYHSVVSWLFPLPCVFRILILLVNNNVIIYCDTVILIPKIFICCQVIFT